MVVLKDAADIVIKVLEAAVHSAAADQVVLSVLVEKVVLVVV
jgi:hypothetical protein